MALNLNPLFMEAKGRPIDFMGRPTVRIYRRILLPKSSFRIEWLHATREDFQGLRINTDKANLEVTGMGKKSKNLILWAAKEPEDDIIEVRGRTNLNVSFWNAWHRVDRDGHEHVDEWYGNSAMQLTESGNTVLMECSDGFGEPDFTDLVMRITFYDPTE